VEVSAAGVDKRCNAVGRQDRSAVYQHNVAADTESGRGTCDFDGFAGGGGAGHERGAGDCAGRVQLGYGAIDARSQAKVVGIYYQAAHRLSVSSECDAICWPLHSSTPPPVYSRHKYSIFSELAHEFQVAYLISCELAAKHRS